MKSKKSEIDSSKISYIDNYNDWLREQIAYFAENFAKGGFKKFILENKDTLLQFPGRKQPSEAQINYWRSTYKYIIKNINLLLNYVPDTIYMDRILEAYGYPGTQYQKKDGMWFAYREHLIKEDLNVQNFFILLGYRLTSSQRLVREILKLNFLAERSKNVTYSIAVEPSQYFVDLFKSVAYEWYSYEQTSFAIKRFIDTTWGEDEDVPHLLSALFHVRSEIIREFGEKPIFVQKAIMDLYHAKDIKAAIALLKAFMIRFPGMLSSWEYVYYDVLISELLQEGMESIYSNRLKILHEEKRNSKIEEQIQKFAADFRSVHQRLISEAVRIIPDPDVMSDWFPFVLQFARSGKLKIKLAPVKPGEPVYAQCLGGGNYRNHYMFLYSLARIIEIGYFCVSSDRACEVDKSDILLNPEVVPTRLRDVMKRYKRAVDEKIQALYKEQIIKRI